MSAQEVRGDEQYEAQNDQVTGDAPAGSVNDNSYLPSSSTGESKDIPVMKDEAQIEDPVSNADVDPNSDAQLGMHISSFFFHSSDVPRSFTSVVADDNTK